MQDPDEAHMRLRITEPTQPTNNPVFNEGDILIVDMGKETEGNVVVSRDDGGPEVEVFDPDGDYGFGMPFTIERVRLVQK